MKFIKQFIFKSFIGKNIPTGARAITTFLASSLLIAPSVTKIFYDGEIEPELAEAHQSIQVTKDEVNDGLTVGEVVRLIAGASIAWASAFISWSRARKLDWLGKNLGFLFGRSVDSLVRRLLTLISGGIAYLSSNPEMAPEIIANHPVESVIASILTFASGRLISAFIDSGKNPIEDNSIGINPNGELISASV